LTLEPLTIHYITEACDDTFISTITLANLDRLPISTALLHLGLQINFR